MGIPWDLVCGLEIGGNLSWQAADSYCVFVWFALIYIRQVHNNRITIDILREDVIAYLMVIHTMDNN